jgi:hypothetical protein
MNPRKQAYKDQLLAKRAADLSGTGSYLFQNNTKGDLYLPRPTSDGKKIVRLNEQFIGDSYYFCLLKTHELKLIKELETTSETNKMYIFENNTKTELHLPKPTCDGITKVLTKGQFRGDSYYFSLLKTGQLKLIREVERPVQDKKLIVEQPPTITEQGKVEQVKSNENKQNENKQKEQEILLTEDPLDGIKVLLD